MEITISEVDQVQGSKTPVPKIKNSSQLPTFAMVKEHANNNKINKCKTLKSHFGPDKEKKKNKEDDNEDEFQLAWSHFAAEKIKCFQTLEMLD